MVMRLSSALSHVAGWVALALLLAMPASAETAPATLLGHSYDYGWDGRDIGHPERAWLGRAYGPPRVAKTERPVPLVVFLHGLNAALIKHRWMGGGSEGDVRQIVGDLVASGAIPPVVVAAPSSIVRSQVAKGASWNHFDLDRFVDHTVARLRGVASIDETRIVVAGHSGAGCSAAGGLAKLGDSKRAVWGAVAIDTCMFPALATRLLTLGPSTHVVVGYQKRTWSKRPFASFRAAFQRGMKDHPASAGVLRVVDEQQPVHAPHDATVKLTFDRWLPKIFAKPVE